MRILQLHVAYRQPGGEEVVVDQEARLLRSAGHEVVQHVVPNPTRPAAAAAALVRSPWNAPAARAVEGIVRRCRPDVAHVHNTWYALSASVLPALSAAGVPVVATLHNYRLMCLNSLLFRDGRPCHDCVGTHPWRGVVHRCYRDSALASAAAAAATSVHRRRGTWDRDVDAFIALTQASRRLLLEGGLPGERVQVKPNFVEDEGPRPAPPSSSSELLFVGRLAPGKGVDVLLRSWSLRRPPGLSLLVVGDGPLRAELEGLAGPGVTFLGRLPRQEVGQLMRRCRALVFPAVWEEPFGLVLVEALAAGLPVVASDLEATREVLGAEPARFAPPGDERGLAEAIAALGSDDLVDRAGVAARRAYDTRFTPSVNLLLIEAIYRSVQPLAAR